MMTGHDEVIYKGLQNQISGQHANWIVELRSVGRSWSHLLRILKEADVIARLPEPRKPEWRVQRKGDALISCCPRPCADYWLGTTQRLISINSSFVFVLLELIPNSSSSFVLRINIKSSFVFVFLELILIRLRPSSFALELIRPSSSSLLY